MAWRFGVATSIGVAHTKAALPCQDVALYRLLTDTEGKAVIAFTASDGAGSAARAEVGAALATSTLLDEVERFLRNGGQISSVDHKTAATWIDAVRAAITVVADAEGCRLRDFACTLLAAVVTDAASLFVQVGDGAIVVADSEENEWSWVFWPQHGEFINTTTFVTEDSFRENLQVSVTPGLIREVALFTDGIEALVLHYASKTVHTPFFKKWFELARQSPAQGYDVELSKTIEQYLGSEAICSRTSDDKSLILATRRNSSPNHATATLQQ